VGFIIIAYISYEASDSDEKTEANDRIKGGHKIIDYWVSSPIIEMINDPDSELFGKGVNQIWIDTEALRNYLTIKYVRNLVNETVVESEELIPNHMVIDISVRHSFHDMKEISNDTLEEHK